MAPQPNPKPNPPEPEDFLLRLSKIYNAAAARAPAHARPRFQKVATAFDAWRAAAETGDREVAERKKADFSLAWDNLKNYSRNDGQTLRLFIEMSEEVLAATEQQKAAEAAREEREKTAETQKQQPRKGRHFRI